MACKSAICVATGVDSGIVMISAITSGVNSLTSIISIVKLCIDSVPSDEFATTVTVMFVSDSASKFAVVVITPVVSLISKGKAWLLSKL